MVALSLLDSQMQTTVVDYWFFNTEDVILIGRSPPPDNHIFIDNKFVSRKHLELRQVNQSGSQIAWQIVNHGANPTFLNNSQIEKGPESASFLLDGDRIQIGVDGPMLKFNLQCTHAQNFPGNQLCRHCNQPLQSTVLNQMECEQLLEKLELNLCVDDRDYLAQLYQDLTNERDFKNAAKAQRLLDKIEQLKSQAPSAINLSTLLPLARSPRSQLEQVDLVETKTNVHSGSIVAVAISPDCQRLVSSGNREIKVWNLKNVALAHTLISNCSRINIRPDGQTFVITFPNFYRIDNLQTGQNILICNNLENIGFRNEFCISPDGQIIAGLKKLQMSETPIYKRGNHSHHINSKEIVILHLDTGEILCNLVGHSSGDVRAGAFSSDGKIFASGDSNGIIKIWRLGTAELPGILTDHSRAIQALAISPDGEKIVSCSADNNINIWNLDTGQPIYILPGNENSVIAISLDSQILVSCKDKEINIWEMETGQLLKKLSSYSPQVTSVAIGSDGQMLVTGGSDGTIQIWRVL